MTTARNAIRERSTPRDLIAESMTDRLAKLAVGRCESRVQRVKLGSGSAGETLTEAKRRMVSNTTPVIARVRERYPERVYEIETANFIGNAGTVYVACIVHRLK